MDSDAKNQWDIFLIYNIYRLIVVVILFVLDYFSISWSIPLHNIWPSGYYAFLSSYFLTICIFIYIAHQRQVGFTFLVMLSTLVDLIFLNSLVFLVSTLAKGAGIFLNISLAAVSILLPGKLAVFFAAIESTVLLSHSAYQYVIHQVDTFFYAGIHGVGFFATALTALVLARWIRKSSELASKRRIEVLSLQKMNAYIVERLQSGILFIDHNNCIKFANEAAKKIFSSKVIKANMPLDEVSLALSNKVTQWQDDEHDLMPKQYMLTDPEVMVNFLPSMESDGDASLIVLEDTRVMVQHAQQLKLASLGRFTASIAHELRNPLGAISHAVQLLKESEDLCKEDIRLTEIIHNNCDRMNLLIKNILQLSRRQKSKPVEFGALVFLENFKKDFFQQNEITMNIEVIPEDIQLVFDKSQLSQIMVILAENSAKYGKNEAGQAIINYKCYVNDNGAVVLRSQDEGSGIEQDKLVSVFEPFFTTSRQGVGLGLFIAKELCEANQAILKVIESDKGACFEILFKQTKEPIL